MPVLGLVLMLADVATRLPWWRDGSSRQGSDLHFSDASLQVDLYEQVLSSLEGFVSSMRKSLDRWSHWKTKSQSIIALDQPICLLSVEVLFVNRAGEFDPLDTQHKLPLPSNVLPSPVPSRCIGSRPASVSPESYASLPSPHPLTRHPSTRSSLPNDVA